VADRRLAGKWGEDFVSDSGCHTLAAATSEENGCYGHAGRFGLPVAEINSCFGAMAESGISDGTRWIRGWLSPAKINLNLAVHGRREDGFHSLSSVVMQVDLFDRLELSWDPHGRAEADSVYCAALQLPAENTVLAALRLFRAVRGVEDGAFSIQLDKRIPAGAGLGGGSGNAAAVIGAAERLFGFVDGRDWRAELATIGSDCPLFSYPGPVLMQGRGERLTALESALVHRLKRLRIWLIQPPRGLATAAAYGRLARNGWYSADWTVEDMLARWRTEGTVLPPAHNDFERLLAEDYPAMDLLLKRLRRDGFDARMSGSGSAFFTVADSASGALPAVVRKHLEEAFGGGWKFWNCGMYAADKAPQTQ
jgi:4-diphosphocytidyl-2-C-methyl-D-erythritol kinase